MTPLFGCEIGDPIHVSKLLLGGGVELGFRGIDFATSGATRCQRQLCFRTILANNDELDNPVRP